MIELTSENLLGNSHYEGKEWSDNDLSSVAFFCNSFAWDLDELLTANYWNPKTKYSDIISQSGSLLLKHQDYIDNEVKAASKEGGMQLSSVPFYSSACASSLMTSPLEYSKYAKLLHDQSYLVITEQEDYAPIFNGEDDDSYRYKAYVAYCWMGMLLLEKYDGIITWYETMMKWDILDVEVPHPQLALMILYQLAKIRSGPSDGDMEYGVKATFTWLKYQWLDSMITMGRWDFLFQDMMLMNHLMSDDSSSDSKNFFELTNGLSPEVIFSEAEAVYK